MLLAFKDIWVSSLKVLLVLYNTMSKPTRIYKNTTCKSSIKVIHNDSSLQILRLLINASCWYNRNGQSWKYSRSIISETFYKNKACRRRGEIRWTYVVLTKIEPLLWRTSTSTQPADDELKKTCETTSTRCAWTQAVTSTTPLLSRELQLFYFNYSTTTTNNKWRYCN